MIHFGLDDAVPTAPPQESSVKGLKSVKGFLSVDTR